MKRVLIFTVYTLLIGVFVFISCQKELECYNCDSNKPPVTNAGLEQKITLPKDSVHLDGNASSDADGKVTKWLWTKITGPASLVLVNTTATTTMVKNLIAGVYSFQLQVTDDKGALAKDTVQVVVDKPPDNQPPIACAGGDQSIVLPTNSATLDASCSSDADNNISIFSWSNVSGPSTPNIGNANL